MKRFYAIAILILSALTLRALQVDTVAMQQLIASGQRALCTAIEHNNTLRKAGATTGYRFFVTPDPPAQTNARVEFVGAQKGITIPQSVIDTLNARCSRDYVQFGVELFLIHINSLDVIVNGQMPQTVNLRDLLVNGLYDEQSNLDSLRQLHKEISSRIFSGVALSLNRTSLFYVIGDYCAVFNPEGKEGCWRLWSLTSWAGPGQIGDHDGEFRDNLRRRIRSLPNMLLPDRFLAIENEFRESMTVYNQRQLITSSFHPNFLNAIFENFDADAFADLTLEQRLHALHVYSGYPMLSAWLGANSEEHFVLQIIKTAPPDQAKGLLQGMEAPSTAIEGNNAYTGTKNGEALIYKLVDRTNDAVIAGPNNYQLLMKYVSATCTKSPQAIDYCVAATDVAQFNTVINWKDSYWLTNPPAGHLQYIVEFKTTGKISYKTKTAVKTITYVQGGEPVETTQWDESPNAVELSPFSFIILNNTSGLSMIGDVMNGPGAQMVPAVMLKYCADKQFNDQAITACAVALDIVGVVTGPGLITAALRAGRLAVAAFEAVQLLGAVGNLVANSSTSPNLQAVIDKYNAIVGIWGLARIATSGARYTADYFTAAKQNNLATISETAAQEYEVLYNTAKTDIDAAPEAVKGPLDKMKQLVGKGVSGVKVLNSQPSWLAHRVITGNLQNPIGLIGVYERQLPDGTWIRDTKHVIEELAFPETYASNFVNASKGGFKLLNTNPFYWQNPDQFWIEFNAPWLNGLKNSGADVVVLSDKSNDLLKYKWTKGELGEVIYDIDQVTGQRIMTGFGKEIQYMDNLVSLGVEFLTLSGAIILQEAATHENETS